MADVIGYLFRRSLTLLVGLYDYRAGCVCMAYRCGRPQIETVSKWCRRHTDAILHRRSTEYQESWSAEVAARLAGENVQVLKREVEAGQALARLRYVKQGGILAP